MMPNAENNSSLAPLIPYKVEAVGPLAPTYDEAQKQFARVREMLLQHIKTFVFLPG